MITFLTAALLSATVAKVPPVEDARAILKEAVETTTVKGRGQVPLLAAKIRARLIAAGFAPGDVVITPIGETAILNAVFRGTGDGRPIAVLGHLDVVEADPKDWTRDPFKMVDEDGFMFGRGVFDNKFDVSMIVATLIRLKAEGYKPRRDIIIYLSGDEETDGKTAQLQAQQAKAANVEFVLNSDAGGGTLGSDGKPLSYAVSGAEKSYVDFEMTVTNPGGHSSVPRPDNAIYSLTRALNKIADYQFAPQINDITRVSLIEASKHEPGPLGTALAEFAINPADAPAVAMISRSPEWNAQIRTTCVTTQLSGGHAPNALPQRATANVNCRLFPGVSIAAAKAILTRVIDDRTITVMQIGDFPATDASPLRADVLSAVTKAVHARFPSVSVAAGMDKGQTDSIFYRAFGIPSYGVSGLFIKDADNFIHGLNERIPSDALAPALVYWHSLLIDLTD